MSLVTIGDKTMTYDSLDIMELEDMMQVVEIAELFSSLQPSLSDYLSDFD